MPKKLSDAIKALALPTVIAFLLSFGWGGKKWPTVNAMIEAIDTWLNQHTDYPWIFAAGVAMAIMWGGYKLYCWHFVSRKEKWRARLITLLKEGVAIRNEGEKEIANKEEAGRWVDKSEGWNGRVFKEIAKWDKNLAEDYDLLDVSDPPRLEIKTAVRDHEWQYQHHDHRLLKLRKVTDSTRELS